MRNSSFAELTPWHRHAHCEPEINVVGLHRSPILKRSEWEDRPAAPLAWTASCASLQTLTYTAHTSTAMEPPMITRHAVCSCGQLHLTIEGEPSRISLCHCLACQRRTGAVISNQARFRLDQVIFTGKSTQWTRKAESGNAMTFHFCPTCGSTVFWENNGFPGFITVAIGNFADPSFPAPNIAVWEEKRHPWVALPPDTPLKRESRQG